MSEQLYRVDYSKHRWSTLNPFHATGSPINKLEADGVLVLVEPCEHGRLDAHWPKGICRCFVDALDPDKGRGYWRDTGEEYVPDKWVLCTHEPFCLGVALDIKEDS